MNTELGGCRYRIYLLTEPMLNLLFRQEATVRCMCGVPADARYLGSSYNFAARAIEVAFEYPSFDLVPDGDQAPRAKIAFELVDYPWEGRQPLIRELGTGPHPLDNYIKGE